MILDVFGGSPSLQNWDITRHEGGVDSSVILPLLGKGDRWLPAFTALYTFIWGTKMIYATTSTPLLVKGPQWRLLTKWISLSPTNSQYSLSPKLLHTPIANVAGWYKTERSKYSHTSSREPTSGTRLFWFSRAPWNPPLFLGKRRPNWQDLMPLSSRNANNVLFSPYTGRTIF